MAEQQNQPPRIEAPYFYVNAPRFDNPEPPCRDPEHEDKFFGPDGREPYSSAREREHRARRLCQGCPFQIECALHALESEEFGVWGGLSERDRVALGGVAHRSVTQGQRPDPERTITRLGKAGFTGDQVKALLRAWRRRRNGAERSVA